MNANEIMSSPVVTVTDDTTLERVAALMLEHDIGALPVLSEAGELVGIVTDSDFAGKERYVPFSYPAMKLPAVFGEWLSGRSYEELCEHARRLPVSEVMSSPVVTGTGDEPIQSIVERMLHHDVNRIPIVRDGLLVGIVARHDLLKVLCDAPVKTGDQA